jgi:hypothetical protein
MRGRYFSRAGSESLSGWRLAAFCLLVLVCYLTALPLCGQNTNDGEPSSTRQLLQRAELSLSLLVPRLEEREREATALRVSLQLSEQSIRALSIEWQEKWEGAQSTLETLRTDLREISASQDRQQKISDALSQGWKDYREFARKQIAELERQVLWWKIGATVSLGCAVAATVWALTK